MDFFSSLAFSFWGSGRPCNGKSAAHPGRFLRAMLDDHRAEKNCAP